MSFQQTLQFYCAKINNLQTMLVVLHMQVKTRVGQPAGARTKPARSPWKPVSEAHWTWMPRAKYIQTPCTLANLKKK